jgi:hypothetical protein
MMHANGGKSIEKVVYSKVIIMIKGFNTQGVDGEQIRE